jgi:hypothetical protein
MTSTPALISCFIEALQNNVSDEELKAKIYSDMIQELETQVALKELVPCYGKDDTFDEVLDDVLDIASDEEINEGDWPYEAGDDE